MSPSVTRVLLLASLVLLGACDGATVPLGQSAEAGGPPLVFGATISITWFKSNPARSASSIASAEATL